MAQGGDLGEVDGHAAEFDAGREALDQAPRQHDEQARAARWFRSRA